MIGELATAALAARISTLLAAILAVLLARGLAVQRCQLADGRSARCVALPGGSELPCLQAIGLETADRGRACRRSPDVEVLE